VAELEDSECRLIEKLVGNRKLADIDVCGKFTLKIEGNVTGLVWLIKNVHKMFRLCKPVVLLSVFQETLWNVRLLNKYLNMLNFVGIKINM
jgi:hypothetical protein